jgi:DNA-binding MarR family transcriptional regulator
VTERSAELKPTVEFMARLRKIDRSGLKVRDVIVLWAIREQPGMMGRELAMKIGLESRSNVQDQIARLIARSFVEDRRKTHDQQTPNDLHILPAGRDYLASLDA